MLARHHGSHLISLRQHLSLNLELDGWAASFSNLPVSIPTEHTLHTLGTSQIMSQLPVPLYLPGEKGQTRNYCRRMSSWVSPIGLEFHQGSHQGYGFQEDTQPQRRYFSLEGTQRETGSDPGLLLCLQSFHSKSTWGPKHLRVSRNSWTQKLMIKSRWLSSFLFHGPHAMRRNNRESGNIFSTLMIL